MCKSVISSVSLVLIAGALGVVSPSSAQLVQTAPATLDGYTHLSIPGKQWKLLFSDEFSGSSLDQTKWTTNLPWEGPDDHHWHTEGYASFMQDEDVHVQDGFLKLTCQKKNNIGPKTGKTYNYTAGFVHTSGKFTFVYGYAEARCKAPLESGPGLWPAFWTLSEGWPPEFDIIEVWTSEPRIHQGYAFKKTDGKVGWDSFHDKSGPAGWHTYAMEWGPGYIFFSMDGKVTKRIYGDNVTHLPQYLILNSGVCSGKGNVPPAESTQFPNSFDVDWCRVYSHPAVAVVHNSGWEYETAAPWKLNNQAAAVSWQARSGSKCLRLYENGSAEQRLYGLKSNTSYVIRAWAKAEQGQTARMSIHDFGGAGELFTISSRTAYAPMQIHFTTGSSTTPSLLRLTKSEGSNSVYVDDVEIVEQP